MKKPKFFDLIALTVDLPEENLWCGQADTIVEIYQNGAAFEVEFVDNSGHTYSLTPLRPEQIMSLRYQPAERIPHKFAFFVCYNF